MLPTLMSVKKKSKKLKKKLMIFLSIPRLDTLAQLSRASKNAFKGVYSRDSPPQKILRNVRISKDLVRAPLKSIT